MAGLVSPRQFGTSAYELGRLPVKPSNISLKINTPDSDPDSDPETGEDEGKSNGNTSKQAGNSGMKGLSNSNSGGVWNSLGRSTGLGTGIGALDQGVKGVGNGLARTGEDIGSLSKGIGIDEIGSGLERAVSDMPSELSTAMRGVNAFAESSPVKSVMDFGSIGNTTGSAGDSASDIVSSMFDAF